MKQTPMQKQKKSKAQKRNEQNIIDELRYDKIYQEDSDKINRSQIGPKTLSKGLNPPKEEKTIIPTDVLDEWDTIYNEKKKSKNPNYRNPPKRKKKSEINNPISKHDKRIKSLNHEELMVMLRENNEEEVSTIPSDNSIKSESYKNGKIQSIKNFEDEDEDVKEKDRITPSEFEFYTGPLTDSERNMIVKKKFTFPVKINQKFIIFEGKKVKIYAHNDLEKAFSNINIDKTLIPTLINTYNAHSLELNKYEQYVKLLKDGKENEKIYTQYHSYHNNCFTPNETEQWLKFLSVNTQKTLFTSEIIDKHKTFNIFLLDNTYKKPKGFLYTLHKGNIYELIDKKFEEGFSRLKNQTIFFRLNVNKNSKTIIEELEELFFSKRKVVSETIEKEKELESKDRTIYVNKISTIEGINDFHRYFYIVKYNITFVPINSLIPYYAKENKTLFSRRYYHKTKDEFFELAKKFLEKQHRFFIEHLKIDIVDLKSISDIIYHILYEKCESNLISEFNPYGVYFEYNPISGLIKIPFFGVEFYQNLPQKLNLNIVFLHFMLSFKK